MRIYKRFFCVSILPLKINLQCSLLSSSQTMVIITQQLFNMALFGCAGSSLPRRLSSGYAGQELRRPSFSPAVRASALSAPGLYSTGSRAVAHRLSRLEARGIFSDLGSHLCLLPWQADSSSLSHQGNLYATAFNGISIREEIQAIYGGAAKSSTLGF